jgi:GUN4-like
MKKTFHKFISSLVILSTASILSLSCQIIPPNSITEPPLKLVVNREENQVNDSNSITEPPQELGGSGGVNTANLTLIVAAPKANKEEMYQILEQYLADGNFQKADEQTLQLMNQVANNGTIPYLTSEQLNNFSGLT